MQRRRGGRWVIVSERRTELAWLVTRALWGDLQRDLRDEDVVFAEEAAASLRRRLRGAQPMYNRVLAAVNLSGDPIHELRVQLPTPPLGAVEILTDDAIWKRIEIMVSESIMCASLAVPLQPMR